MRKTERKKIAIGSDHGGFELKESLKKYLGKKGYRVLDVGTYSEERCDYPDFIERLYSVYKKEKLKKAIFICKTGIGSVMCLNKFPGFRAAGVYNEDMAKFSRRHNDANVIVFGAKYTSSKNAQRLLEIWLDTNFEGGRHRRRINKFRKIERGKFPTIK